MTRGIVKCFSVTILTAVFAPNFLGCSSDAGPPLKEADLVSAKGSLSPTEGELDVAVSPQDEEGAFIGHDLPQAAFKFENVTIHATNGTGTIDAKTRVTDVEVIAPEAGVKLTAVVVFDSSGSMATNDPGQIGRLAGGEALFDALRKGDRVAVLDFGAGTTEGFGSSRLLQEFTQDNDLLMASLDSLEDSGGTPMYASLTDALDLLAEEDPKDGGTIVVLTDGAAEDLELADDVVAQAVDQSTEIFAVALGDSPNFDALQDLGEQTGGGSVLADDPTILAQRFKAVTHGASLGRVVVSGRATYDELPAGSQFEVKGDLVTTSGDNVVTTAFSFRTSVP